MQLIERDALRNEINGKSANIRRIMKTQVSKYDLRDDRER